MNNIVDSTSSGCIINKKRFFFQMGNDDFNSLYAVADLLADVIAFLLPLKKDIPEAAILDSKFSQAKKQVTAKTINELDIYFRNIKSKHIKTKNAPATIVRCLPLMTKLDQMVSEEIRYLVTEYSGYYNKSRYLLFKNGINSESSRTQTNIMILPRYITGCNVVWTNTCSALKDKPQEFGTEPVCVMTRYYKNKEYNKEPEEFIPKKPCIEKCKGKGECCLFISEIEGCIS